MNNIQEIIAEHQKWIADPSKGKRGKLKCCDLSGLDLSTVDVRGIDLSHAVLANCKLPANCRSVKLVCARGPLSLSGHDISGANFEKMDLESIDLIGAIWNATIINQVSGWIIRDGYWAFATNAFVQIGCMTKTMAEWETIGGTRESLMVLHQEQSNIDLDLTWSWWETHKKTIRDWYSSQIVDSKISG